MTKIPPDLIPKLKIGDVLVMKVDKDLPDDESRYQVGCVIGFNDDGTPILGPAPIKPN